MRCEFCPRTGCQVWLRRDAHDDAAVTFMVAVDRYLHRERARAGVPFRKWRLTVPSDSGDGGAKL